MGCKELRIGCHISCKEKALVMEKKDQDSQQIRGREGGRLGLYDFFGVFHKYGGSGIHGGGLWFYIYIYKTQFLKLFYWNYFFMILDCFNVKINIILIYF